MLNHRRAANKKLAELGVQGNLLRGPRLENAGGVLQEYTEIIQKALSDATPTAPETPPSHSSSSHSTNRAVLGATPSDAGADAIGLHMSPSDVDVTVPHQNSTSSVALHAEIQQPEDEPELSPLHPSADDESDSPVANQTPLHDAPHVGNS